MSLVDEAIIFATRAHSGQIRKLAATPYILHPLEVATIIGTMTSNEETIAAGLLHDTIEDTDTTPEEITEKFGKRVFALVQSETEDKFVSRPAEETWLQRKEDTLLILKNTKDINVKILWLGDKLSNIRSFWREYQKHGDEIWQSLHQKDPKMHEWYYNSILENLSELSDTAAYKEYKMLINLLFKGE